MDYVVCDTKNLPVYRFNLFPRCQSSIATNVVKQANRVQEQDSGWSVVPTSFLTRAQFEDHTGASADDDEAFALPRAVMSGSPSVTRHRPPGPCVHTRRCFG